MSPQIFAIRDIKANQIVGGLHIFKHQAVAVRFFGDIASNPETMINRHIDDHELIVLGTYDEDTLTINALLAPFVVIAGFAWLASQATAPKLHSEAV